jgi:hypothetical protein
LIENNLVDDVLYKKLSNLPPNMKNELLEYMEFLIYRINIKESRKHPKAGCMKGMFAMSDDFNEPLECFNEYRVKTTNNYRLLPTKRASAFFFMLL